MPHSDADASRWIIEANTQHLDVDAGSLYLEAMPLAAELNSLDAELYSWIDLYDWASLDAY